MKYIVVWIFLGVSVLWLLSYQFLVIEYHALTPTVDPCDFFYQTVPGDLHVTLACAQRYGWSVRTIVTVITSQNVHLHQVVKF